MKIKFLLKKIQLLREQGEIIYSELFLLLSWD